MDAFYFYTYGSAVWLIVQAVPLCLAPKLIVALLADDGHQTSDIEIYLSRSLALSLIALALLLVLLTGSIPLTVDGSRPADEQSKDLPETPYAKAAIFISTILHSSSAIYNYTRYTWTGHSIYTVATLGWTVWASLGLWCLMFGTEKSHISKRTGADKRVSGWPFKNVESDKRRGRKRSE